MTKTKKDIFADKPGPQGAEALRPASVDPTTLQAARAKVVEITRIDEQLAELAEKTSNLTQRRRQILDKELIDLLDEAGTDRIGIPDLNIDVLTKTYVAASLPKDTDTLREAYKWLIDNNHGTLIKCTVAVPFDRTDHNRALDLAAMLEEKGYDVQRNEGIHHSTYSAWAKQEHLEKSAIPIEMFPTLGITTGRLAEIKPRKEK